MSAPDYRDPEPRLRWLVRLLPVYVLAAVATVVTELLLLDLITAEFGAETILSQGALETLLVVTGAATVIVVLGTLIRLLMLVYRLSANMHAMGLNPGYTRVWAVGWFFVPFANLVIPYRVLAEMWRLMEVARPQGWLLGVWLLWAGSQVLLGLTFRPPELGAPLDTQVLYSNAVMAATVLDALAMFGMVWVLARITRAQIRRGGIAEVFS
ncbi:MAG: DUF4328 domain-containing protein [Pseudomonadota bacterium]